MLDDKPRIFDDDGNEINSDLIPKPDLCVSCKKMGRAGKKKYSVISTELTSKVINLSAVILMNQKRRTTKT